MPGSGRELAIAPNGNAERRLLVGLVVLKTARPVSKRICDVPPENWTVLSWKIPIYDAWSGGGIFHEEIEVHREPDCLCFEAG